MKEKYNSEKKLHDAFGSFQMPFEQEAFDKFIDALDKEKENRRVVWWRRFGLILIPFLILGSIASYALLQNRTVKEAPSSIQSENTIPNSTVETSLLNDEASVNSEVQATEPVVRQELKKANLNDESALDHSLSDTFDPTSNLKKPYTPASMSSVLPQHSISSKTITTNLYDDELSANTVGKEKETESLSAGLIPQNKDESKSVEAAIENIFQPLKPLSNLTFPSLLQRQNEDLDLFDLGLKPYVKPYKKYFYIRLFGGFATNDNFGPYDRYFNILDSREYTYGAALAFKFSPNHAVELSFSQHDFAVGYRYKEAGFTQKNGSRATVLKAALISRLWTLKEGIELNMTNGLAIMNSGNGSFGKRSFGQNTPTFIQESTIQRLEISSSRHVLFSAGLRMDVSLSRSLDLSFDSNYNLGFKPWMNSQLQYIEGEGVINTTESYSEGNFFSFTVGLKYSLKGR